MTVLSLTLLGGKTSNAVGGSSEEKAEKVLMLVKGLVAGAYLASRVRARCKTERDRERERERQNVGSLLQCRVSVSSHHYYTATHLVPFDQRTNNEVTIHL